MRSQNVSSMSFANNSSMISTSQVVNLDYTQRLRREPTFTSSELSVKLHRKSSAKGMLYQASASSVMLAGNLGNLKQTGNIKTTAKNSKLIPRGNSRGSSQMGNIMKKPMERKTYSGLLMNSPSKVDPEELKSMGNEKYKQGKFEEALGLYDRAISLDSDKASFFSNKSAALMSLGRLMEAVFAGLEAIKIEPTYYNAHYRLARLYLRLGDAEKALYHFNFSGRKASSKDIHEAQALQTHLSRCAGARRRKHWDTLVTQTQIAITMGADSAPQIYAMQAEALVKLNRHDEAYVALQKQTDLDVEACNRLFGAVETANLLTIRSQVYMTVGRFDDAVAAAKHAELLDSSIDVNTIVKRVEAVAAARTNGNDFFSKSRFKDAVAVYSTALELEPYNSILLCNRAACRSKLGMLDKAVEDCTLAISLRPSYNKARMRRADCYAKLERWESAVQDYEVLMQEVPGDDKVTRGYEEAKEQLEKSENFQSEKIRTSLNVVHTSNSQSEHITTAAEFYTSGSSFKFISEINISPRTKHGAGQFGSPVASLKAIPIQ